MSDFQNRPLRVLLPAKPADSLADLSRALCALLPAERTHVRRFYVHRPVESSFFLPETYARFRDLPRLEFEAEIATRAETEREMRPLAEAGFETSSEIIRGVPVDEVLQEADLWRADFVAVRTHSAAAADHRVGSMASALFRHGTCPVLTCLAVPAAYRIRRILIPVDFSRPSRLAADWGLALAETIGAEPVLLHTVPAWKGLHGIDDGDLIEAAREEIERWREGSSPALSRAARETHVVRVDDVAEGIVRFAEEGEHDLIVMSATGASAVRAILVGSNTRKVLRATRTPVLVIPPSNRMTIEGFLSKAREAAGIGPPAVERVAVSARA